MVSCTEGEQHEKCVHLMTSCKCKSYITPFTGRPGSPLFPSLLRINEVVFIHYSDIMMVAMASQITSVTIGYSTVYSGANQRKHRSFASLAFVQGIHRSPVNSLHKWPVTQKMFPFVTSSCPVLQFRLCQV